MRKEQINFQIKGWHYYMLVFFLGIIPLFYHLGEPVLSLWDESRRAVNAYEMYENGDILVTHFNGEPDMWGTKPPLLIWMQTLSMHVFGVNEWAIRFPSALAGLLLGFLLLWFSHYYTRSYLWGFISVLILYTSVGYVDHHSVRTGDFDALMVLFTTAASLLFFLGVEEIEGRVKNRFILLFFIFLSLAVLTKSIVALLMAPAYLIFLIYRKQFSTWLRNKYFYLGMVFLVILIGGFYFVRDILNPGYIKAVINNEITGRYMETLEQNKKPFFYYFKMLYQYGFKNWYYLVPIGIFLAYFGKNIKYKRLITFFILVSFVFLLVISTSQTKLQWYYLPVLPFLSMMAALFLAMIIRALKHFSLFKESRFKQFVPLIILLFFFAAPYYRVYKRINAGEVPKQEENIYNISHYLRDLAVSTQKQEEKLTILYEGEFQHFLFYVYKLRDQGYEINFREPDGMRSNVLYIVYQEEVLEDLRDKYELDAYEEGNGVFKVLIR